MSAGRRAATRAAVRRAVAGLPLLLLLAGCAGGSSREAVARFTGSAACSVCHAEQAAAWRGSHHDLAMQVAGDSTVLGDFGGVTFTHFGIDTRFFRRDAAFMVNTEGADGAAADFEILYTFGVHPLQQYLVAFPGGRLQVLPVAWDAVRGRWFHMYPHERIAPDDPLHWTGRRQNWNAQCAACHSTDLRKGYDPAADAYATTWSDLNVGCEACHGAGSAHVAWAERAAAGPGEPSGGPGHGDLGLSVSFGGNGARVEVETCAPCHSRRAQLTAHAPPGAPLLDHVVPVTLEEDLYHADGQILEEVYVYGSFVQSRMHAAGVTCGDCHDPHSLKLRADGNALCTRCHGEAPDRRFPALKAARYDAPEHHFHAPGTPGAMCVDCHMPARTYMVVDPRRDHGFKVPRPDLAAVTGAPDACTGCHGRSPGWAARAIAKRHGAPPAGEPFGVALAAGRAGAPGAGVLLARLAVDTLQPAIARATALGLLPRDAAELDGALEVGARDRDPLVRVAAARVAERLPAQPRLARLAPLLEDPRRAVRIEAARALAPLPRAMLGDRAARALDAALAEYAAAQSLALDLPEGHLNMALLHEALGDDSLAAAAYRAALARDPAFRPAAFNLAHLYNRTGRNEDAGRILREAIERMPGDGELHYSLDLLLAESSRHAESAAALGRAAALLPERARVALNHGLALQHLGRTREAQGELERARRLDPSDPDVPAALCVLHLQSSDMARARREAEALLALAPADPRGPRLLARIERGAR